MSSQQKISCNPEKIEGTKNVFSNAGDSVAQKAAQAKAELQMLYAYAAADPAVSTSLTAGQVDNAAQDVYSAVNDSMEKLSKITWEIMQYSELKTMTGRARNNNNS